MTTVKARDRAGVFEICAENHAGDVEACNYITGALYAFGEYVVQAEAQGYGELLFFSTDKGKGSFYLLCTGDERVRAAFEAACLGIEALQRTRPDAVQLIFSEN